MRPRRPKQYCLQLYIYLYCWRKKQRVNYKFILTGLFRGCPLVYFALLLCIEHCFTKIELYVYIYRCIKPIYVRLCSFLTYEKLLLIDVLPGSYRPRHFVRPVLHLSPSRKDGKSRDYCLALETRHLQRNRFVYIFWGFFKKARSSKVSGQHSYQDNIMGYPETIFSFQICLRCV